MAVELVEDSQADLATELARLKEEHRDLDSAIEALERSVAGDQLQIQRLKKRKLTLRDRISYVEDQITPDIIA
ncbi:YdcH family protein [Methylobacterium nigriterrae]|uniref:YdcH family protein n=1 Tax=Methylobacterium nigriterrae TaxID=3127512 RepID=UPI003013AE16